jgi:hypothetical protein
LDVSCVVFDMASVFIIVAADFNFVMGGSYL